jgi:hypothetical protein
MYSVISSSSPFGNMAIPPALIEPTEIPEITSYCISVVPFVFPYTEFKGRKLMDSLSIGWNVNMIGAIEKCLDQVDDHSKIILDVMVMYPNKIEIRMPDGDYNTIHNYFRQRDFEEYYSLLSDIEEFIRAYPDI